MIAFSTLPLPPKHTDFDRPEDKVGDKSDAEAELEAEVCTVGFHDGFRDRTHIVHLRHGRCGSTGRARETSERRVARRESFRDAKGVGVDAS